MTPPLRELHQRGQRGWPPSYPVAQLPNAPLLLALLALLVAALTRGVAHDAARATFYAALAAWAWQEVESGANIVRRGLGAAALVLVVARITGELRG